MQEKILIVDDSPILRRAIRKTVLVAGADPEKITEAGNGQEAIDALQSAPVDLILLDLNMPVMDGETFVKTMREQGGFGDPRIIIVSTESNQARLDRLRAMGVADVLPKPFEPEALCRLVSPGQAA